MKSFWKFKKRKFNGDWGWLLFLIIAPLFTDLIYPGEDPSFYRSVKGIFLVIAMIYFVVKQEEVKQGQANKR